MKKFLTFALLTVTTSLTALAQGGVTFNGTMQNQPFSITFGNTGPGTQLISILNMAQNLVSRLVPFLVGLAVIAFFWYLVLFIWRGNEEPAKRQEGMKGMMYSLVALFVMVSIWGIIAVAANMIGVGIGGSLPPLELPKVK